MIIGYRYSVDDDDNIYIIRVSAESYKNYIFANYIYACSSEECICESITNANTEEEVNQAELRGYMNHKVCYKVGEKIPVAIWFCLRYDDLFPYYLVKKGARIELSEHTKAAHERRSRWEKSYKGWSDSNVDR